jgi:hypothetical protein
LLIKIIELKNGNWREPNVDICEWINQEKLGQMEFYIIIIPIVIIVIMVQNYEFIFCGKV